MRQRIEALEAGVRAAAIAAVFCSSACADGAPRRDATAAPSRRVFAAVKIDTVWSRGSFADTVIELPMDVRADGDLLVLADGARRGIAALHTADGSTAWTVGRRGRGPGEFERPSVVEFLPDGRLLVADVDLGRVTILDRSGRHAGEFPLEDVYVTGLCALADGRIVAVAATEEDNFRTLTAEGASLGQYPVPWEDLRKEPMLARQFLLSTPPDRRDCLFALSFGRGFGSFDGERFGYTRDFIEVVEPPEVEVRETRTRTRRDRSEQLKSRVLSARAVASADDLHYVVFDGTSPEAGRILDVYTRDGTYDHSVRLARRPQKLAWSDGVFYVLTQDQGVPVITAMRIGRPT